MKRRNICLFIIIILAILVAFTSEVLPRAGSGQRFRPPSRPSLPLTPVRATLRPEPLKLTRRSTPARSINRTPTRPTPLRRVIPAIKKRIQPKSSISSKQKEDYPKTGIGEVRKTPSPVSSEIKPIPMPLPQTNDANSNTKSGSAQTTVREKSKVCFFSRGVIIAIVVSLSIAVILFWIGKKVKGRSDMDKKAGLAGADEEREASSEPYYGTYESPPSEQDVKTMSQIKTYREKDPYFDEEIFLDKALQIFIKVKNGISKNDSGELRPYLSERQFERIESQMSKNRRNGWTRSLEILNIHNIKIIEIGNDGDFDYIRTRIQASITDSTYDRNGLLVDGSSEPSTVTEYWTFIRKQGAMTSEDGGKTGGDMCPNCGGPLINVTVGKCPYCEAPLSPGSLDWVVNQIIRETGN